MTKLRPVRSRYFHPRMLCGQSNKILHVCGAVLTLVTTNVGFRQPYTQFRILTNAAGRVAQHFRDVGFTLDCRTDRGFEIAIAIDPEHVAFARA